MSGRHGRAEEELSGRPGILRRSYDPTVFVRNSIKAVVHTLFEAILLVVVVVILFLQTWRASIIPLAAVPVSLVGTFAVMLALGFSHQHPHALRPGARHRHRGRRRDRRGRKRRAQHRAGAVAGRSDAAGDERSDRPDHRDRAGAVRGVHSDRVHQRVDRPVLQTVRHHDRDLDGHFRVQFADAFAGARARAAQDHHAPKDWLARFMDRRSAGSSVRSTGFSRGLATNIPPASARVLRKSAIALVVYAGCSLLTGWSFNKVPTGFVPTQDKQYLVAFAQLPDGGFARPHRSRHPPHVRDRAQASGVANASRFPGSSISGFSIAPNSRHRLLRSEAV